MKRRNKPRYRWRRQLLAWVIKVIGAVILSSDLRSRAAVCQLTVQQVVKTLDIRKLRGHPTRHSDDLVAVSS